MYGVPLSYGSRSYLKIHFPDWSRGPHLPACFWISSGEMVTRSVNQDILGAEELSGVQERAMERQTGLGAQFF